MGRFTEKQLVLATIVVAILLTSVFGLMTWLDWQAIVKNEITDANPAAAEETNPEEWGERRKIQEIKKQHDEAQKEADQIPKREQDVIVYREIVSRDSQILPDVDDVNRLANIINDFEQQAGVHLKQIGDLSINPGNEAIKTMPVKLQLEGTFDRFLKFVNLFENLDRMINTKGFSISAGRVTGAGAEREAIHDIQLDLVTYIYTPSAGLAKPVEIANYDKRKEDPVIQKLVRQQKAARVEKYQLKPRINRRDPLVDPRRPAASADPTGDPTDVQKQREILDALTVRVAEVKADVLTEKIYVQEKKYVALASLKPLIDQKCAELEKDILAADPKLTAPELREAFRDDVVSPFEAIKGTRNEIVVPVLISRKQSADFLEKMKTAYDAREYENVVKILAEFDSLFKGQVLEEDAKEVVDEMKSVAKEAQAMVEFIALKLKISGLILQDANSTVLINGKARRTGDTVDQAGRCRLKEIHADVLVFTLDGLDIEYQLKR